MNVEVTGLIGIYCDPGHVIDYNDGEVRQEFSICFRADPVSAASCVPAANPRKSSGSPRTTRCAEDPSIHPGPHQSRIRERVTTVLRLTATLVSSLGISQRVRRRTPGGDIPSRRDSRLEEVVPPVVVTRY